MKNRCKLNLDFKENFGFLAVFSGVIILSKTKSSPRMYKNKLELPFLVRELNLHSTYPHHTPSFTF